jgi:hypothetical protein
MNKSLQHQVAVCLSLTFVTRDDDNQTNYATIPVAYITGLFFALRQLWPVARIIIQTGIIWYKLAQITFNSLAFAMQETYAGNLCRKWQGAL